MVKYKVRLSYSFRLRRNTNLPGSIRVATCTRRAMRPKSRDQHQKCDQQGTVTPSRPHLPSVPSSHDAPARCYRACHPDLNQPIDSNASPPQPRQSRIHNHSRLGVQRGHCAQSSRRQLSRSLSDSRSDTGDLMSAETERLPQQPETPSDHRQAGWLPALRTGRPP